MLKIIIPKGNAIKTTVRYHFWLLKKIITSCAEDVEKLDPSHTTVGTQGISTSLENRLVFSETLNRELPYNLSYLFLGMYHREVKNIYIYPLQNEYMNVSGSLFFKSKKWKQLKWQSVGEWINKISYVHKIWYCLVKKIISYWVYNMYELYAKWKKSSQRSTYQMILFIWNVQNRQIYTERK